MPKKIMNINLLTPSNKLHLYNKRIIVTAPRNYAKRLSEQIINYGGLPIIMSTIEICVLDDYTEIDKALTNINKFDWIAFTSRNGIEAFFQRLNDLKIPKSILQECSLCAIGKDAERLSEFCGKVDLIPQESSPEGIIVELSKIPNIQGQKILVPVPKVIDIQEPDIVPKFVSGLKKVGMEVTRIPAYITRCLAKDIYEVELNLIFQDKIDAIAFSSTAEVESFLKMLNSKTDSIHSIFACFGPYTAANAKKMGINVSIVSTEYSSFAGFAEAIALYFAQQELDE
jgi:uroporphyrinogen-III synthase